MVTPNLSGQTFGQYELRDLLGAGGMGTVYRAYQASLKRYVAVKVLSPQFAQQAGAIERFNREAQTSAALEHPHIIHIYDYGLQHGVYYLVLQLLTGGTLAERVAQRAGTAQPQPSLGEISDLLKQLASALDYAHSEGVIHRDIKASNVMFDNHGTAYLVDFGIARLKEATSGLTASGVVVGTWAYMAPEQWQGEAIVPATDQYALAVMTYGLITGRMPFEAQTPAGVMHKHLNAMPTPAHTLRPDVPEALTLVLERALAKRPEDRFPTITAFAQAFEQGIRGQTGERTAYFTAPLQRAPAPSAIFTPTPQRVTQERPIYRHPVVWGMGVALLAAIAIVLFLLLRENGTNSGGAGQVPTATAAALVPTETRTPVETGTPPPTFTATASPDATQTSAQVAVVGSLTLSPSSTASPTEMVSPTATVTASSTPTATSSDTPTAVSTPTRPPIIQTRPPASATPTLTPTPSLTRTATFTASPTRTPTATATFTHTPSPTWTVTPRPTITPTPTIPVLTQVWLDLSATAALWTATPTITLSPTVTPTWTRTPTPTLTSTPTFTLTSTANLTATYDALLYAAMQTLTATMWTATPTPTATSTPSPTSTPFFATGARNSDWMPVVSNINSVPAAYVPAGCFMMGSENVNADEQPVSEVCLDAYWIGQTEVTNAQYHACVDAGACEPPQDRRYYDDPAYANAPVVYVNWQQSRAYTEWVGGRLPTEAEWEYAARGPASWEYPWGNSTPTCQQANSSECGVNDILPVGPDQRPAGASWVGALDMAGNVDEWTSSAYVSYPYVATDGREDLITYSVRVLRGGAWTDEFDVARSANREWLNPVSRSSQTGFRVAWANPLPVEEVAAVTPATTMTPTLSAQISPVPPTVTPAAPPAVAAFARVLSVVSSSDGANLRDGPGVTFDVVGSLSSGTLMEILSEQNSWYQVRAEDGREGWVANYLVEVAQATNNSDWQPVTRSFDGVPMALVPAGCFMMGSGNGEDNEQPASEVCLDAFWVGQTEVTNSQYLACVNAGACEPPSIPGGYDSSANADYPVVNVTWFQARVYSEWAGGRLPSEAEWEYAARGPESWDYPWGDTAPTCEQANTWECGVKFLLRVGAYQRAAGASWVGALDMAGNALEWTNSAYRSYPYSAADGRENTSSNVQRVLRGGSWFSNGYTALSATRTGSVQSYWYNYLGFRVVRSTALPPANSTNLATEPTATPFFDVGARNTDWTPIEDDVNGVPAVYVPVRVLHDGQ